jgi:DNA-binding PadR family transcriptional regulator
MDIIILKHLRNNHPMSGYDVIKYLYKNFHMLPSPGAVYSLLYSLERQNLVEGRMNHGKRIYKLTGQGEKYIRSVFLTKPHIQAFLFTIFSEV